MSEINVEERPGDVILRRYMPDATDKEREAARENLCAFASVLLRIDKRLQDEIHMDDSRESKEQGRFGVRRDSPDI